MSKHITYDMDQEPIVLSKILLDTLLKQKNPADLIALYTFYYYTAKWQKTNCPKASISYVTKGLGWGQSKVRSNKKILIGLNLINDVQTRDEKTSAITGHYIQVNFIWANNTTKRIRKTHPHSLPQGGSSHRVGSDTPNALSTISLNALSSNNKTIDSKYIKFVLEFNKIQKENHPKFLKKNMTKKQCNSELEVIAKLIRLDGFDFEDDIRPAILWAAGDDFWTSNVYSLNSLRKKSKTNGLTKFQNILSSFLKDNSSGKKSNMTEDRKKSYKNWEEDS